MKQRREIWFASLGLAFWLSAPGWVAAQLGGVGGMGGGAFPGTQASKTPERYRPARVYTREEGPEVAEIRVNGNRQITRGQVLQQLVTKPGRPLDTETLQNDVRKLVGTGMFEDVQTLVNPTDHGVIVTYQVRERPLIREIRMEGNDKISDRKLLKKCELTVGSALTPYRVEEGRRKLHDVYREAGFTHAEVTIDSNTAAGDGVVAFQIVEGPKQRIWKVKFVGNSSEIVTDARLRSLISSKSAVPWWFKSTLELEQLDRDCQLLVDYYRRLGFFMATVSRTLDSDEDGSWSTVVFVIDEGPRYRVRNIEIIGNRIFATGELMSVFELPSGSYYDRLKMDTDLKSLRDTYGAQGYIFADIQADIQFLEQPGALDLVYRIQEGDPYFVRDIHVQIKGDNPHTRHSAIMNYLSISPMDIVDIREIRDSKRRLGASQIVETNPALGPPPDIQVVPAELSDYDLADRSDADEDTER